MGLASSRSGIILQSIYARLIRTFTRMSNIGWVGAVDGRFDPATKYEWPNYYGFMRVKVKSLWELYLDLEGKYIWEVYPAPLKGWIPVYASGERVGQDESGEVERDFS
ncbi:hypothetical protein N7454_010736 [Penicillium verhagenii]|nr:hypothetical protein N7454_010736 [Penicillium verhagenii]